jgi:hypothetical protein
MRKKITKEAFNVGGLLLTLLLLGPWALAQKDYNKVFEKSFNGIKEVAVTHRRGPIEVLPSDNGRLTYPGHPVFQGQRRRGRTKSDQPL